MSGALFSLLGMGMVFTYRTARVLNLAHGESFAVAGIGTAVLIGAGVPYLVAVLAATLITVALAITLQWLVLRPRSDWPPGTLILITLGFAFVVRGVLFVVIGADPVSFSPLFDGSPIRASGAVLPLQGLALITFGLLAAAATALFLTRTRFGKQLLATAENPFAAQLLGVDIEKARLLAYGLAGLLGAIAGVLLVPLIAVDFQAGLGMTLRAFIAAAISGMSPGGVLIAGVLLGLFESLVGAWLGALAQDPVIFVLLIAIAVWQSRTIRFGGGKRA